MTLVQDAIRPSNAARRPLQPHGTTARANGRKNVPPCNCEPCTAATRRYKNHRQALAALGHPGNVPSARASRHANALADAGMTWNEILAAARVSRGVLAKLLAPGGDGIMLNAGVEARILAVQRPAERVGGERRVDGVGTCRRLRALARAGWTCEALAVRLGVTPERVAQWRGAAQVTVGTRSRVRALYAELENTPGRSRRAELKAERDGWLRPVDWDGLDMDDPAVTPTAVKPALRLLVVAEEAEFLASQGLGREQIAAKLGLAVNTLDIYLTRARKLEGSDDRD